MLVNPAVLDLASGEAVSFGVRQWQLDELDIRPASGPGVLRVRALRVLGPIHEGPHRGAYFDLVSQTAIEALLVWLAREDHASRRFTLTKLGSGPASRWSLAVGPAQA